MSWPTKELGELVQVLSGYAFQSELFNEKEGIPIIRIRDVVRGFSNTRYSGDYDPQYLIEDGQCLIGMDGEFNAARWQGGPAVLNQRVCRIEPASGELDAGYLFHFLPRALKAIEDATPFVTVKHLSVKQVRAIQIPLPPINEQKRLSAILDKADVLRRKRREAIAKLDALLQSLFLETFGRLDTNPKGWPLIPLQELLTRPLQNGAYFPQERYATSASEGVEMVHMTDAFYGEVHRGGLRRVLATTEETAKYGITYSDVLIARRSLNYEGSAKPCTIPSSNEPLLFESSLIRVTPSERLVSLPYLVRFFNDDLARRRYVLPRVTKSTISGINQDALLKVTVPVPDLALQHRFVDQQQRVHRLRAILNTEARMLDRLFQSLSNDCFGR